MKIARLMCAALVASCGLPAEHHPVADFALDCREGEANAVRGAVASFAQQSGLSFRVPQATATQVHLRLDGEASLGHHISVDWWAAGRSTGPTPCVSDRHPCVVVTAQSGGTLSEEMSEASVAQRRTAMALKRRLEWACKGSSEPAT